jgi:hypothetical protein
MNTDYATKQIDFEQKIYDLEVQALMNIIEIDLRNAPMRVALHDHHETFHRLCAQEVKLDGLWLEFGVYTGRSLEQFSRYCPHDIYGFDCFEGLPEEWDENNPKNCYSLGGRIPAGYIVGRNHSMFDQNHPTNIQPWPKNVKLVPGYFDQTLPKFVEKFEGDVALLHIDSDLYSSAATIFKELAPRIKKDTVIVFDEIINYPTYKDHEIKAFAEFLKDNKLRCEALICQDLEYGQGAFRIL